MNYSVQTILKNKNIHYYKKITYNGHRYKKIEYFYDILSKGEIKETCCHNDKNPAVVIYSNNKVIQLEYWIKGKLHRKFAPAVIHFLNNKIDREDWWYEGTKLTDEEVESVKKTIDRRIKITKLMNKIKLKKVV